jgi:hypothetical protein
MDAKSIEARAPLPHRILMHPRADHHIRRASLAHPPRRNNRPPMQRRPVRRWVIIAKRDDVQA